MQINKTNNVIFLRDIDSNIIQEAFVVLRDNIKLSESTNEINKIDVLKEAEELINHMIDKNDLNFEKYKILKLKRKLKIQKIFNIFCVIILILCIIIK